MNAARRIELVAALLVSDDGFVFLSRHPPHPKWHLPDGDIRDGESFADAMSRAFKEDFGTRPTFASDDVWYETDAPPRPDGSQYHFRILRGTLPNVGNMTFRDGYECQFYRVGTVIADGTLLASTNAVLQEARRRGIV